MGDAANSLGHLRAIILSEPDVILEDRDIMRALVAANETARGENVVDLRGVAMERLEHRLDRLEDTHRSVIAAAYENLAGTNQIHRAVLAMLEAPSFEAFLNGLSGEVTDILRIESLRLVLESESNTDADIATRHMGDVLSILPRGFIESYLAAGRERASRRPVLLRRPQPGARELYGPAAHVIRSEALLRLDFGAGMLPGLLALGSRDTDQFRPDHATDLLAFFGGVFERQMRRWLG